VRRLNLRGNRGRQKEATVETTLKVLNEHELGDYPCVDSQVCDPDASTGSICVAAKSRGAMASARRRGLRPRGRN